MRRLPGVLLAAALTIGVAPVASAADMPLKAPISPVATGFNWTGIYIGGFVGLGRTGSATTSDPCLTTAAAFCAATGTGTYNGVVPLNYGIGTGFLGGGTIGFNWQLPGSQFLLGIENEFGYLRLNGSAVMNAFPIGNGDTLATTTIGNWYDAYTVRAGITWNQTLLYAKVGGVSAAFSSGVIDTGLPVTINTAANQVRSGWAAGGGLEYGLTRNWSVKAEYLFLGIGTTVNNCAQVGGFPPGTIDCTSSKISGVNTFKIGMNYRFN